MSCTQSVLCCENKMKFGEKEKEKNKKDEALHSLLHSPSLVTIGHVLYVEQSSLIALLLVVFLATAEIRPLGETVVVLMSGKGAKMEVKTSSDSMGHITLFFLFYATGGSGLSFYHSEHETLFQVGGGDKIQGS